MTRMTLLAAALLALLFTPGFVCASRVERLEGEVDALRVQFEEIQQRINNDQAQVTEMILRADEKIVEIEDLQRRATDLLTGNTADLTIQLDQQKSEIAELRGNLESEKRRLEQLQKEVAAVVGALGSGGSGSAVVLPADADGLYQFGVDAAAAGRRPDAMAAFDEFVVKYPTDPRADDALYGYVENANAAGMHIEAVNGAKAFLKSFAESKHVNDTILLMGRSAAALGSCDVAKASFDSLKDTKSHKTVARRELKALGQACP